jgi:hypothetical protein
MGLPSETKDDVMDADAFETHFANAFDEAADAATEEAAAEGTEPPLTTDAPPVKTADEIAAETAAADVEAKRAADEATTATASAVKAAETKRLAAEGAEAKRLADAAAAQKLEESKKALELTEDEAAMIAEVAKDFPEVKKALEAQERILTARFNQVMDEKFAAIQKDLEPVRANAATTAKTAYEAEILKGHADALDLLPDVEKWIETLPAVQKRAYNYVLDNPVPPAEVVELFTLFKEATGRSGVDGAAKAAEKAAALAEKARVDAEKAKKLDSMGGVRGRQAPRKDTEPKGFDEAFMNA